MKTLLITGGAGFIGANFVYHELKSRPDYRVVCFDKLTYAGNLSTLGRAMENPAFSFVRGDIADEKAVDALFARERPDLVVNFAAESHVDRSILTPGIFLTTNILGTQVLMDACRKYSVSRFHQVSTDEVYGDLPLNAPELRFTESNPLKASSPYSASKAGADLLVGAYERTYGLPVSISRCSNNYGPFQFPEKLIPLLVMNALEDKPLPIYGKGENIRDWLYVEDHCRAIDLIINSPVKSPVYNLGGGAELTNIEIARRVCRALNKPESLITHVEDRKGHDLRYAMDYSLIEKELGWRPLTSFDEGLDKTISWYCQNTQWLELIKSGEYEKLYEKLFYREDGDKK